MTAAKSVLRTLEWLRRRSRDAATAAWGGRSQALNDARRGTRVAGEALASAQARLVEGRDAERLTAEGWGHGAPLRADELQRFDVWQRLTIAEREEAAGALTARLEVAAARAEEERLARENLSTCLEGERSVADRIAAEHADQRRRARAVEEASAEERAAFQRRGGPGAKASSGPRKP